MDQYLEGLTLPEGIAVYLYFPFFVAWRIATWVPFTPIWRILVAVAVFAIVLVVALFGYAILTHPWNDWLKNINRPKPLVSLLGGFVSCLAILGAYSMAQGGANIVPWVIIAMVMIILAPSVRVMGVEWD